MSRCFDMGCAGCDECCDDEADDGICPECEGDGRDKWNDYLLPCPVCNPDVVAVVEPPIGDAVWTTEDEERLAASRGVPAGDKGQDA